MSKCKKCGAENPSGAYYCGGCGSSLYSQKRVVVPKGTRRIQQELEEKYITRPTIGTGFSVLWRAIENFFSRAWAVLNDLVDFEIVIIVLANVVIFGYIIFFSDRNNVGKYSALSKNGYYALFKKDKQLTPYQYDTLVLYSNYNGDLSYVIAKQGGKYGRLNRKGQVLDSCIYDQLYSFNKGWAITEINGLFGYIKEKKKGDIQIINPKYLQAGSFSQGFSRIQYADKTYGWIDSKGHEVSWGKVYGCGDYRNGYAWISIGSDGREYGYVDKRGNVTNLHATAETQFDNGRAFFSKGGGWAMIDRNLKQVTDFVLYPRIDPSTKQYIKPLFRYDAEKKLWICLCNGEECFVNKKGEIFTKSSQNAELSSLTRKPKSNEFSTKRDSVSYLMGINFGSFIKGYDFGEVKWKRVSKGITDFVNSKGIQKNAGFENQFDISPSLINTVFNSYLSDRSNGIKGSKSRRDSVAYLLGVNFGSFLKNNHFGALDNQTIKKGLDDYLSAKGDPKDTLAFLAQFRIDANLMNSVFNDYLSERRNQIAHANFQKEKAFLTENRTKPNVVELPSGLQYIVIKSGNTSKKPKKNSDTVYVKYKGTFLDGSLFDETSETDADVHFQLSKVIRGWQEGLKKIGEGGEIRLFVPSSLAYGDNWNSNIEPNSLLVFDVQLNKVVYGR